MNLNDIVLELPESIRSSIFVPAVEPHRTNDDLRQEDAASTEAGRKGQQMLWLIGSTNRVFRLQAALRLGVLLLVAATLHAQQFTFTAYGEGSGLTNLNGAALIQDHTGVVWAATQNGLFAADGNSFHKNLDLADSGFENIRAMREDGAGRVWVTDGRKIGFLQNGKSQILRSIKMHTLNHEVLDLVVLPGQRDGVYLLRAGELLLVSTPDQGSSWQIKPAINAQLLQDIPDLKTLSSVAPASGSKLLAGCGRALCMLDLRRQTADRYTVNSGVPDDQWIALQVMHSGEIWARGIKNLVFAARDGSTFVKAGGLPSDAFGSVRRQLLMEDHAGRLILNLSHGIALGGKSGWQILREGNGLPEDEIDTLMQDRSGALWLTSLGHGVLRWRGYGDWEGYSKSAGLQSNIVWSVTRDAGKNLWVASNNGLDRIDLATQKIVSAGFSGQRLYSAVVDQRQHVWFDDSTGRVLELDPLTGHSRVAADGFEHIFQMHLDRQNRLWACTRKGLVFFSAADNFEAPHAVHDPGAPTGYAWSIAEAPDGTLWVDADKGIFRLKGTQWSSISLNFDDGNHENRMIGPAADGTLWLQNDLPSPILHVRVTSNAATIISKVDVAQIASDNTTFIEVDRRGWVWVGSDDGVHVFNGTQWALCTAEDGLLWNDTDFHAFTEDQDGSVWIGTSAGVSHVIHPERIFDHALPQVQLIDVSLSGRKIPDGTPAFDLRKPTLSFRLRNVNYDRGSAVVAQYRLDGEETEWHDTNGAQIRFPALASGIYNLRIRAYDQRLGQTSAETRIHFRVLEPWWKRGWFLAMEGLGAALLMLGLWRLSVSLLVARQRQLAHLVALRTSELENEKRELLSTRSALLEIARRDALTGLLNRSAIFDQLEALCQVSSPHASSLAVVMADLDSFKKINDNYGHLAGDAVLRECASRMRHVTRDCDLIGRYGGEELLIVLVGLTREAAAAKIEAIRLAICTTPVPHHAISINVTCSFGVAWFDGGESRVEDLLSQADSALYCAKRNGRNRVEYSVSPNFCLIGSPYLEAQTAQIQ